MKRFCFLFVFSFSVFITNAQVVIADSSSTDKGEPEGVLDIRSKGKDGVSYGVVMPRVADFNQVKNMKDNSPPAEGTLVFDSVRQCLMLFADKGWQSLNNCVDSSDSINHPNRVINVLSLLPHYKDDQGALGSSQSEYTKKFKKKLQNSDNFGPTGKVKIKSFEFDEVDLSTADLTSVREKFKKADILYMGFMGMLGFDKYKTEIINWIKGKKGAALLIFGAPVQNLISSKLGYDMGSVDHSRPGDFSLTSDFIGPFGNVAKGTILSKWNHILFFMTSPQTFSTIQLLRNSNRKPTGFEDDSGFLFTDPNLIYGNASHDNFYNDDSGSCANSDQSKFFCNVFAKLVEKAIRLKGG